MIRSLPVKLATGGWRASRYAEVSMILRQFLHTDPVAISYLFGCGGQATAAVVDPVGDIAPYVSAAKDTGMRILYVIDTHIHADHASSGPRLAEATGAEYVLFAEADATVPFRGVRDHEVLTLGNVTAEILHTPGHTPEHMSVIVTDRTRSDDPWFVLTGHTLMVGDVGRTELAATPEDGARISVWPVSTNHGSSERVRSVTITDMCSGVCPGVWRISAVTLPSVSTSWSRTPRNGTVASASANSTYSAPVASASRGPLEAWSA